MTITLALVQISLLFLPGIVWASIDARFVSKKPQSQLSLMVNSFLFGITSYAVTFILYSALDQDFGVAVDIGSEGGNLNLAGLADEIVVAVGTALVLSILWVYAATYKLMTRLLLMIRATKRYGDEDVWDYVFNLSSPISEYVNVRIFDRRIVYSGYVAAFSETDRMRELMLRDVEIHDFEGRKLFSMPHIYIARAPEDIHIEFPYDPRQ